MEERSCPAMISLISGIVRRAVEQNDAVSGGEARRRMMSVFHGLARPGISVTEYMERIYRYANCSTECYVVAYIYLDRFLRRQPWLPLDSFTVHRLLIAAVLAAVKFVDDLHYNNAFYAQVGGITTFEMNMLELDFLFGLDFQLNISASTFSQYCSFFTEQMSIIEFPPLDATPSLPVTNNDNLEGTSHNHQLAV